MSDQRVKELESQLADANTTIIEMSKQLGMARRKIQSLENDLSLFSGLCSYCRQPLSAHCCWNEDCHLRGRPQSHGSYKAPEG